MALSRAVIYLWMLRISLQWVLTSMCSHDFDVPLQYFYKNAPHFVLCIRPGFPWTLSDAIKNQNPFNLWQLTGIYRSSGCRFAWRHYIQIVLFWIAGQLTWWLAAAAAGTGLVLTRTISYFTLESLLWCSRLYIKMTLSLNLGYSTLIYGNYLAHTTYYTRYPTFLFLPSILPIFHL